MTTFAMLISTEHLGDLLFWIAFLVGQCVWVFICACAAIRSKTNPLKRRVDYVKLNWDILAIRFFFEALLIFFPWRHIGPQDILKFFGQTWQWPFGSSTGPGVYLVLGVAADSLFNAVSKSKKLPEWLRQWIQEKVPQVPMEIVANVETKTTITPVDQDQPITETTTTTPVVAPVENQGG